MEAAFRQVRLTVVVSIGLVLVAAVVLLVVVGLRSPSSSPLTGVAAASASTTLAPTVAPTTPVASEAPSSTEPHFADGLAARMAAEGLMTPYLLSQRDVAVTDVACSEPPTGAAGEQFVCYGLKEGDLVIALRATIGADRLITLELITDQQPTTTTTTTPPTSTSVAPTASTVAG